MLMLLLLLLLFTTAAAAAAMALRQPLSTSVLEPRLLKVSEFATPVYTHSQVPWVPQLR